MVQQQRYSSAVDSRLRSHSEGLGVCSAVSVCQTLECRHQGNGFPIKLRREAGVRLVTVGFTHL